MNNLEKLEHILNVFNKRILPAYLFYNNQETFLKWQGNICKQSAVLSAFIIKHYMGEDYVKVEAWEGFFEHKQLGEYNHCWNYIIHKDDPKKNIICDFTSTITYMDYCEHNDPTLHIKSSPDAVVKHEDNIQMIGFQEINIEANLKESEFYTSAKGEELETELKTLLKFARLWEEIPKNNEKIEENDAILHIE